MQLANIKDQQLWGEVNSDDKPYKITVAVSKKNKTLEFSDNGIGMTADEIDKYINQVAFSGAEDFFNKYKDKMEESNDIIGHFGLGFYSAFMYLVMLKQIHFHIQKVQNQSDGNQQMVCNLK